MLVDQLNLNQLRVFEHVYRSRNMTAAAQALHLTQSGVSQHIKSLEAQLSVKLFDRISQRLLPTKKAEQLFEICSRSFSAIEEELWKIKDEEREFSGQVCIGMPMEFGHNIVQPLVASFARKHPKVSFKIILELAPKMNQLILDGDVDFAFVDDFPLDSHIRTEAVYNEVLELCASQRYLKKIGPFQHKKEYYEKLDYVDYDEGETMLKKWFATHLAKGHVKPKIKAYVANSDIVARIITTDLAAGVLSDHIVNKLLKEGHKIEILGAKSSRTITNGISLAYLDARTTSVAAQALRQWLKTQISHLSN